MTDWRSMRVVVVGAARQGTALARYLVEQGAHVILNDRRGPGELQETLSALLASIEDAPGSLETAFGSHTPEILEGADLLCLSGGVPLDLPLVIEALAQGIPLSNDSQIFLEETPSQVLGITGSAGKTTTTTLVGRMAQAASDLDGGSWKAFVGGNIGAPLIQWVEEMQPGDVSVMELSSFQLEIMTRSPQVAAVLNITPNHLDRHASMEEYTAAKARILDFQDRDSSAVLSRDDPGSSALSERVRGRLFSFGLAQPGPEEQGTFEQDGAIWMWDGKTNTRLVSCSDIRLRGRHNLQNVVAACAIAAAAGFPIEAIQAGVAGFEGVAHRLEFVRSTNGAEWYNDSIATAPERAMAAIQAFDEPLVLLAGGRDKNLPWEEFGRLVRQRVDHLVVFGEAAEKIAEEVSSASFLEVSDLAESQANRLSSVTLCSNLQEAVQAAARLARPGDVVLLSPGGTSFDEFQDFEARGEAFRRWVMELP